MNKKIKITPSSGNVFSDLGIADAEETLVKAEVASRICDIIAERKLSQTRAATVLGVDQPKVSALLHGRLGGFSTDRLLRFLNALGREVRIVVGAKPAKHPRIRVMCA